MMKKIICTVISAVILCSLMTGCSTDKKPNITINIKLPIFQIENIDGLQEINDMYTLMTKAAEEFSAQYTEANVNINVYQYEVARKTAEIDDCFGTDKAADILWGDAGSYIYNGRVVPLDDIISEKIAEDIDETYFNDFRIYGKTYIMPFFISQTVLCYNKDLFFKAGLNEYISDEDIIQSWTLDEWNKILEKLRRNLPTTVYPMMMYAGNNNGDTHIMTLLRSHGSKFFDERGRFNLNTPEGIAALSWIRECNNKGYFPPKAENVVMLDCYDLFMNNQLAIYCGSVALQTLYDDAGMDYGLVNLPSIDGKGYSTSTTQGFAVFDNGDSAKIKVSKDFIKYVYETDWLDYSAGGIPVSSRVAEKYAVQLKNVYKYIENVKNSVNYSRNNPNWNGVRNVFYLHIQDLLFGEKTIEQVAEELDADCNAEIEKGYKNFKLHD